MMDRYEKLLRWVLIGTRPAWMFASLFVLFIISFIALGIRNNPKTFFPSGDPNFIYVYLKMPIGTSTATTDSVNKILESKVYQILDKELPTKKMELLKVLSQMLPLVLIIQETITEVHKAI